MGIKLDIGRKSEGQLNWLSHFYVEPSYYPWKNILKILNENRYKYQKAIVYTTKSNISSLNKCFTTYLNNKNEVLYLDDNTSFYSLNEIMKKFSGSEFRVLVTSESPTRVF